MRDDHNRNESLQAEIKKKQQAIDKLQTELQQAKQQVKLIAVCKKSRLNGMEVISCFVTYEIYRK